MRKLSADYIFPINETPVKDGIILIDEKGRIAEDIINPAISGYSMTDIEKYNGFICPGFINSHCHLELSYLKGKMTEHFGLDKFIVELEQIRKGINEEEKCEAAFNAEQEMIANGIVAVGDICNGESTFPLKNKSKIYYHSFIESFASNPQKAEKVFDRAVELYNKISLNGNNNSASITPHATYSLSKKLFLKIKDFAEKTGNIISIHHQESEEENKFFLMKEGNIKEMHSRFGVEHSDFNNTGKSPLASIAEFLPKNNHLQLVHNTVSAGSDIDFAERFFKNIYWCFCPNANLYIEQKLPDISLFFNKKSKITIGTDSLASNKSLAILNELKTIRVNVPFIPLHIILRWATLNGAEFLGIADKLGSLEKGKSPGIILLENVNTENLQITRHSTVRVL